MVVIDMAMNGVKNTIEQIRALESERQNLMLEIEELKKMADAKARALESEISMLRDEVKELRLLLTGEDETTDITSKKRK
jgi:cell shape-determining protein MreC